MFPTPHHANLVFSAFDVHNRGSLSPTELDHALHAVGLGDAPKQIVCGIIRQSRNDVQQRRMRSPSRHFAATNNYFASVGQPPTTTATSASVTPQSGVSHRGSVSAFSARTYGGGRSDWPHAPLSLSFSSTSDPLLSGSNTIDGIAASAAAASALAPIDAVTLDEFLLVVKELAPQTGSSEEVWKSFKSLDTAQCGRVSLETLLQVLRRDEERLEGKISCASGRGNVEEATDCGRRHQDERLLKAMVDQVAEYREKGLAFDEWKTVLTASVS